MRKAENVIVGISIGDLNGIGGEIVLKTLEDVRMLEFFTPVIFASVKTITFLKNHFDLDISFNGINNLDQIITGKINVFNVWNDRVDINFGQEDMVIGEFAIKSLFAATKALKEGAIDVLVTAPINKQTIQSEAFNFPGHTDYLAQELDGESLMFMVSNDLRIGLLTDHVPVKDIANNITPQLIESKVNTVYTSLQKDFNIRRPKIAVLGINPHTGDNGVIGKEDDEIMRPTLKALNDNGKLVYGPYAADSFFGSGNYKNFDAIIAAYHDQGLIPFKTLSFGSGVNYTAGLSKIRTSPDHGTAFEIAGKGEANINSFKEAVFLALKLYENRMENAELSKNPLVTPQKKI
ncbi:4-hydroxythreonine-4-phosphate dehydrogenase PdxA [Bizionia argentinensis JUB59]|uniref:4-hydroxythreonine-4-phosphate dehydrogenase PdxA n=1 Tax=Bizionia argentinensis JUB59 TaxID=1046627 RepID=G2EEI4_9FLAO|nr:4-hydroxythreonine-4-phosphate dehydrogenase PdxA [Bizionia argentinensis]EGV43150.1 4-hydroxythreonine-4-phosphate dehydrogenase PdxA [Bizionia argentinensis JUB59]